MKKLIASVLALILALSCVFALSGCNNKPLIAVPNDTSNEARALKLLEAEGLIKLKAGAGATATLLDIEAYNYNFKIVEVEAAQIPRSLQDYALAVINSNYALEAGLSPSNDALALEGAYSDYGNILAVKEGRENDPIILALKAALESKAVADYIAAKYGKDILSVVANPTDGYNAAIDYEALNGKTVTVAASPVPHAGILNDVVKGILAAKGITLKVVEYTDYVQPNKVVDSGELDANYFQHLPYLEDFNAENGTKVVSVATIHVEPIGLYPGALSSIEELKAGK